MSESPHLATLDPYLQLHEADIVELRERADALRKMLGSEPPDDAPKPPPLPSVLRGDLDNVERAIAKHEHMVTLGRNERVGELLRAIADDPDLAVEVAADPRAFAAQQGFELPDTIDVEMLVVGSDVSARFSSRDPDVPFDITWTRDGFQALPQDVAPL